MNASVLVRPIEARDDAAVANVIRKVMPEFGAVGDGYAITDAEVDAMARAYGRPRHAYWVLERAGAVVGGAGYGPLEGGKQDIAELRKMYLLPVARGQGFGRTLLSRCLEGAVRDGFRRMYLETLESMGQARELYESFGFQRRTTRSGCTGHWGCNVWYEKELA